MNRLDPHSTSWAREFEMESAAIANALGDIAVSIHHIGSTSISGIYAKPIIDILVKVYSIDQVDRKNSMMSGIQYECLGEYGIAGRRYFRKSNSQGNRSHHVHIFDTDSEHVNRHLAFRDYLIAHPSKAQEYSNLKRTLAQAHTESWELYLDGKDPFIKETEQVAVEWYRKMT